MHNILDSRLTEDEIEIASSALLDLGPGYPQIDMPEWLTHVWSELNYHELKNLYSEKYDLQIDVTNKNQTYGSELQVELLKSVCHCLNISEIHAENGFITFTGSHALERSIASVVKLNGSVITTNPSIDIFSSMLSEKLSNQTIYVNAFFDAFEIDPSGIENAIRDDTTAILIASPDNPSGQTMEEKNIKHIIDIAIKHNLVLILDHCFAKLNPFGIDIPIVANYAPPELNWLLIWDTGKTFSLGGEKAGFIFCNKQMRHIIQKRINTLQFAFPQRWLMLFRVIIDMSTEFGYFDYLNSTIRNNIELIARLTTDSSIEPILPQAGGLMLLDISRFCNDSVAFSKHLLHQAKVGVVPFDRFYFAEHKTPRQLVRIALSRKPQTIELGMRAILKHSGKLPQS